MIGRPATLDCCGDSWGIRDPACYRRPVEVVSCGFADRPWAAVGMDLFMEKPVNRDKLRAMLDLLESDSWQRGDTAADSDQRQQAQQQPLPGLGFAGGQRCNSLNSFSGGLDIKVRFSAVQPMYVPRLWTPQRQPDQRLI